MSGGGIPSNQSHEHVDEELQELIDAAKAKNHEELAVEYARLLYILENAVPDLRNWILGIGRKMRIMRRDWRDVVGTLVGFEADITKLKLDVTELIKQWDQPVDKVERKIVELPAGSISLWEWLEEEYEVPKEEGKK